ncbi:DUF294 nucleotidyltransferase-like domain-containing protein [Marinifilum flexuosum]|uniref:Signal-transduction protein with cAMP-binding, CBS, and nucleotidyltransferase domain n=1 Tax=Marinifilum flexuosum TaxID=1117708 RepID=A0A419WTN3_9BACT|nr:DUF294 nucleotidyltransferase-like domain-containing protein [Marinifilum flexuosum]RKD98776.1 signal-transduction protein with cAMP-binding, CBS, and nucleotidyltransferase domain [Marinifilum flexuosum]
MKKANNKFIYSIVIPTILAISMFVITFYIILIPLFERSMMDRKKETISELTNAAWSVLSEYQGAYHNGEINLLEAQEKASEHIGKMRYGNEQKDYFWIITNSPKMIMHPYRPDLNGTDLSNFSDNHENKLFVDAAELVKNEGEGFIQYYWQWKDDASKISPKLSYVKGFSEWNWVIGTGIYLDDVEMEISQLKKTLLKISFTIILFVAVILLYVLRQTRIIEEKRLKAEKQLLLSIQKYKSLVNASTEGTLMLVDEKVVFANNKFTKLFDNENIVGSNFSDLFKMSWTDLVSKIENPQKTSTFETELVNAQAGRETVVVSVTQITLSGEVGYIIVAKNVTEKKRLRLDANKMSEDIQLSLQLMNQPIDNLIQKNVCCQLNTNIKDAAKLMTDQNCKLICIKESDQIIGIITDTDLRTRVLANERSTDAIVATIMTAPVISIKNDALLYEAILRFKQSNVSHLLIENEYGDIIGNISSKQCLEMQQNSLTHLINQINDCNNVESIKRIHNKVPILIQAVFTSSENINSVSRIITSIADTISSRIIELAIQEVGPAPCKFAFITMGSEGRSEQSLKADQDNAIIFADDSDENKSYFLKLSEIINENLHAIGYSRCKGDLMAGNPEWCNSIDIWKNYFSKWINNPDMPNVLDSSIFLDLRNIYGDDKLVDDLFEHVYAELDHNLDFYNQLAKTVIGVKPIMDKKSVNIKKYLQPIIGYLRIHALHHSIRETNSLLRLNQLMALGVIPEKNAEEIEAMYNFLMHLRIKWQVNLILDNDWPENDVLLKNLTEIEKNSFKSIEKEIVSLQDDLKSAFKISEYQ